MNRGRCHAASVVLLAGLATALLMACRSSASEAVLLPQIVMTTPFATSTDVARIQGVYAAARSYEPANLSERPVAAKVRKSSPAQHRSP